MKKSKKDISKYLSVPVIIAVLAILIVSISYLQYGNGITGNALEGAVTRTDGPSKASSIPIFGTKDQVIDLDFGEEINSTLSVGTAQHVIQVKVKPGGNKCCGPFGIVCTCKTTDIRLYAYTSSQYTSNINSNAQYTPASCTYGPIAATKGTTSTINFPCPAKVRYIKIVGSNGYNSLGSGSNKIDSVSATTYK